MNFSIQVEQLRGGQPRPYADSVYEYRITVSGDYKHCNIEETVLNFCKAFTNCYKNYSDDRNWYESYYSISEGEEVNDTKVYIFTVTSPYLD